MPSARHLGGQNSCRKGNNMNKASEGQWLASRHGVHMNRRLLDMNGSLLLFVMGGTCDGPPRHR